MTQVDQEHVVHNPQSCQKAILAVKDALEVLTGRWKLLVLLSLLFGPKRFGQIARDLDGITDRMLSKELKNLEEHQLVKRTVHDSFPPVVEYSITEHGKSLNEVIAILGKWGREHRHQVIGK